MSRLARACCTVVLGAPMVLSAACSEGDGLRVGLAYDVGGRGDKAFNDAAAAGVDRVRTELAGRVGQVRELSARPDETDEDRFDRLKLLCGADFNVVIAVGADYAGEDPATGPVTRAAKECPDTKFAVVDDGSAAAGAEASNVAGLVFAEEQGSFLVGVAAALKTRAGHVGFVGACENSLIGRFEAGFRAGVLAARPDTTIGARYLAGDDRPCPGFDEPDDAERLAGELYDAGADIVYHAAGGSGLGVFRAAEARGRLAIGVDTDQYVTVGPPLQEVILTSMVKRVDTAVFVTVQAALDGRFAAGEHRFDLAAGGVGYATSGGRVDDIVPTLEDYKRKIINGAVRVPTVPG